MINRNKPSNYPSSDQEHSSESDWTQLSIPDINSATNEHPNRPGNDNPSRSFSRIITTTTSINQSDPDLLSVQLLPFQSAHPIGESDSSSTSFDPQAWKRGDQGTVKRPKRPSNKTFPSLPSHAHTSQSTSQSIPSSSASFFPEAAFIPPSRTVRKSSLATTTTTTTSQTPRSFSHQRRPGGERSIPGEGTGSRRAQSTTRPSSDVGPATKPHSSPGKPGRPTWKAYTGREAGRQTDDRQDFLQALSNLRAMARLGRFEWLSASSSGNEDDADDPRPTHADLPTSTLNSAVGEDDQLLARPCPISSPSPTVSSDPLSPPPPSRWTRWWIYVSQSVRLETWQLLGLGGIIFGFGICTGRLLGRKNYRYPWATFPKMNRVDL